MSELPVCANFREGKCERSDIVYGGETRDGNAYIFACRTCKLLWMISKPRTSRRAAYENNIERINKATERDMELSRRKMIFDMGRRA